jgi:hypothetical protein
MARPARNRAYWDIATHSRKPEGADVLPTSSLSVDRSRHYPHAPVEQTPSDGVGVVECGDGGGPVVRPERGQHVPGPRLGAQAQYRAPAVAGILLRGHGQPGQAAPGTGGRELLCPTVGVGAELVGGAPTGAGVGRDHLGPTLCGAGDQCPLSWLCHSRGVDGVAGRTKTCVATGMAADAAARAPRGTASLL